jgi:putative transposase
MELFVTDADYEAFLRVLRETLERVHTRLLGFCAIYNHWHLVVWPIGPELPEFMHRLTMTHAKRWHRSRGTTGGGHVYQDRYYAVPVQTENHLLTVLRYVERNALRAGLVNRAEGWRWGSLALRQHGLDDVPLDEWPVARPADWVERVNAPSTDAEVERIRAATSKGLPIGDEAWVEAMAEQAGRSVRGRGRPPKKHRV